MDLSAFGEPGNKFLDSDIIEVFHLLPYPCHDCILDLIVIIKILSSKMFFWIHKQVIVAWCKVWALGWMGQNFPLEGLQQLLWWCEKCVDRHYCAVGRPFALAFLTVCFVSCNRFFSGFRSKHQHIWRLLKAESWQEMAPSCPRIWLPWFFMLMLTFWIFLLTGNVCGAIALSVSYSQVYGEAPMFHLLSQCSPENRHLDPCNVWEVLTLQPLVFSCDRLSAFSAPIVRRVSDSLVFL